MEAFASKAWTEIIKAAAVSPLGIAALVILVVGLVIIALVKPTDRAGTRLAVIAMLLVFCGGLVSVTLYNVQPTTDLLGDTPPRRLPPGRVQPRPPPRLPPERTEPFSPPRRSLSREQVEELAARLARTDCGAAWTGWIEVEGEVGNPCPAGCVPGVELGQSFRVAGFPPRPQVKHKFQCWRE